MQPTDPFSWERFWEAPIVGIARGYEPEVVLKIATAYRAAGLSTLEVTMNSPAVATSIATLRTDYPTLNIGAGTVCTEAELDVALTAGAQFIVTPIVTDGVIIEAKRAGVPVFPGAYTPTEIYQAWSLGAAAVKVFPAAGLGPAYVKNVLGPLDGIKL
ncbi:MAG: bifunctional 4-hydroxy-2-oxoglutarate aldolase/2-dehydro-3-deoxy-phosphogluconate aldolase, partial [Bacteroidota bacterium]